MAKTMTKEDGSEEIVQVVPEEGAINISLREEATATGLAPYHKEGDKVSGSPAMIAKMKANGWAK